MLAPIPSDRTSALPRHKPSSAPRTKQFRRFQLSNLFDRHEHGQNGGKHLLFADAARNQLRILPAEVQNTRRRSSAFILASLLLRRVRRLLRRAFIMPSPSRHDEIYQLVWNEDPFHDPFARQVMLNSRFRLCPLDDLLFPSSSCTFSFPRTRPLICTTTSTSSSRASSSLERRPRTSHCPSLCPSISHSSSAK